MSKLPFQNILVFDTETTGLLPKYPSDVIPYITQLSFIVYDCKTESIRTHFDAYIRLPADIQVPEIVTKITGITTEVCQTNGIPIQEALAAFYYAMTMSDCIIAHNIEFDIAILQIEIKRNLESLKTYPQINDLFDPNRLAYYNIQVDCTMRMTVDACALLRTTDKNFTYKKFPKLSETYEFLFKKTPENLHNSMVDTIVCLRCYLKCKLNIDISEERFSRMIEVFVK